MTTRTQRDSFIASPYPLSAALEAAITAALQEGTIDHDTANAMVAASLALCTRHGLPAVVIWDNALCCEQCARERCKA